ncbi:MAG: hypothetical protein CSB28_02325 [Desulfobacterales bacterium]|nr:MAG: hypothetical protein CSB28_02325 [Desulfobacterales bacterium]
MTIEENEAQIHSLQYSQQMAKNRENYYAGLVSTGLIDAERNQLEHTEKANKLREWAQAAQALGSVAALIPQLGIGFVGFKPSVKAEFGGLQVYNMMQSAAQVLGFFAGRYEHKAQLDAINAGHRRREMEWQHQQQLAQQEQAHIQKQMLAAEIRLAMAKAELHRHDCMPGWWDKYPISISNRIEWLPIWPKRQSVRLGTKQASKMPFL